MKEHFLIQSQFAFFFKNSLDRPDELVAGLNEKLDKVFDQIPIMLPIASQKGLEDVPIVTLRSGSTQYSCNLARSRIDLFYNGKDKQDFEKGKSEFLRKILQLFSFLSEKKIAIRRIGFLTQFLVIDEKPDEAVARSFSSELKGIFSGSLHEARLKLTTRQTLSDNVMINNVVQLGRVTASRQIRDEKKEEKGLLVHRDFNTLNENDYSERMSAELVEKLFKYGSENFKLADINSKLWPV